MSYIASSGYSQELLLGVFLKKKALLSPAAEPLFR